MPLYDHFHGMIAETRSYENFHNRWSVAIADDLNERLPKRFLASTPQHYGSFSADVAEVELLTSSAKEPVNGTDGNNDNSGGLAVAVEQATYAHQQLCSQCRFLSPKNSVWKFGIHSVRAAFSR